LRTVASFPRTVREIEHLGIPLSDGCRLSARVWLPEDAEERPVPAILEYLPYRKRDFTRARDEPMHRYFAGHGYAAVRVDLRGSGDSEGLLTDEYTERELADAEEVIAWIAAQPWCSGRVGMMGISWGGFNSLQVAARRPPALAAVITLCSTDDRYADDAHYMGGCLLNENLTWGSVLLTFNAYPPDPETFGPGWRDAWLERLAAAPLFPERWMRHSFRDVYWRHGSVCEGYAAVRCPVYAVGGWADGYSNAVPRLLAGLRCPRKGLIGPWSHAFPHDALPGPAIGFLQEALRWWDRWLKDRATGVMDEPMLRVWMQESVPPRGSYELRPGRWVAEEAWPPPAGRIEPWVLAVNAGRLEEAPGEKTELLLCSPQTTGRAGGDWCAFGAEGELPGDQRGDDGRSLTFDTVPLAERLELLGAPEAELELAADCPEALLAVRLCDVAPDGASTRVTYGLLNLAHRDGHEHPEPLEPGRRYRVRVRLNDVAHAFPAGHAIRLAVSTSYWPLAWPSRAPVTLSLFTGEGRLALPVRAPRPEDEELRPFEPPEQAPTLAHTKLRPARFRRTVERDLATDETTQIIEGDGGEFEGAALARVEDIDLEVGTQVSRRYAIREHDPLSATAEVRHTTRLRRQDWSIKIETHTRLTADRHRFRLEAELRAHEGEALVFHRTWDRKIPRRLV
jgi:hypothetical protein